MRRTTIIMIIVVAFTSALLIYARSQTPRSSVQAPRPESQAAKQIALEKTVTTQQRLNHYFHGDVVPKLKNCWSRLQGKGTIGLKYTYTKAGSGKWVFEKLEVNGSTLPRGQDAAALKCMQDSVRATSFPVEEGEGAQNSFVLNWSWPVPFPANAAELTSAMFAARSVGGGGGGTGGCDGHGTEAKCWTCSGLDACSKVCVGSNVCSVIHTRGIASSICAESGQCASGGPFGFAGGGYIAW